jgi:hypothetical protein
MPKDFKRGQVLNSIWRAFTLRDEPIPSAFSAKVKKLAELGVPLTESERAGHPGVDNSYTAYHAFELAVGLKLLDAGFKQGEVATLVKHIRADLRRAYSDILENPPKIGQNILAKDRPKSPRLMVVHHGETELADPIRRHSADTSYWMTFRSLEFPEILNPRLKKGDLFFEPKFHRGLELLAHELQGRATTYTDDHRFVLELSNLAILITQILPEIRPTPRGRQ